MDADGDGKVDEEEFSAYCSGRAIGAPKPGDRCLASAGYQWCESKGECVRPFELKAEMDTDKNGEVTDIEFGNYCSHQKCLANAGYQWCESRRECVRWFEHKERMDADKDGKVTESEFVKFCAPV